MDTEGQQQAPPGWYDHPHGGKGHWDGTQWTEHTAAPPASPERSGDAGGGRSGTLTTAERIWACAAFGVAVIGSIGPWATIGIVSKAGTDGDGVITLIVAVGGILLALLMRRGVRAAVAILGALILVVGVVDIGDVSSSGGEFFGEDVSPAVGWGLWVASIAGAAALLCGLARRLGIVKPDA